MNNRATKLLIGIVSISFALLLAWRIGLWLEPEQGPAGSTALAPPTAKAPPFASSQAGDKLPFELRDVQLSADKTTVTGIGIVRFDITQAEIRPATEAMLRAVKQKVPAAKRISLTLRPTVECPVCTIAETEYAAGKVTIRYGIPSLGQIDAANALIGTKKADGTVDDRPRLYLPDGKTFAAGLAVTLAIAKARQKNAALTDEQLLEQAANATGLPYSVVERYRDFMDAYYTGNAYGSESFTLSPG